MVSSANVILLPPPGARRADGARAEEGPDRRRGPARAAAHEGTAAFVPAEPASGRVGPPAGRASGSRRSFADELVGESGKAPGALAFAAQRIAQERLGVGAHFEDWSTAIAAYARADDGAPEPEGFAA
jgi:hypothetical protein